MATIKFTQMELTCQGARYDEARECKRLNYLSFQRPFALSERKDGDKLHEWSVPGLVVTGPVRLTNGSHYIEGLSIKRPEGFDIRDVLPDGIKAEDDKNFADTINLVVDLDFIDSEVVRLLREYEVEASNSAVARHIDDLSLSTVPILNKFMEVLLDLNNADDDAFMFNRGQFPRDAQGETRRDYGFVRIRNSARPWQDSVSLGYIDRGTTCEQVTTYFRDQAAAYEYRYLSYPVRGDFKSSLYAKYRNRLQAVLNNKSKGLWYVPERQEQREGKRRLYLGEGHSLPEFPYECRYEHTRDRYVNPCVRLERRGPTTFSKPTRAMEQSDFASFAPEIIIHHVPGEWRFLFTDPFEVAPAVNRGGIPMMSIAAVYVEESECAEYMKLPIQRSLCPQLKRAITSTPYMVSALYHAMSRATYIRNEMGGLTGSPEKMHYPNLPVLIRNFNETYCGPSLRPEEAHTMWRRAENEGYMHYKGELHHLTRPWGNTDFRHVDPERVHPVATAVELPEAKRAIRLDM